MTQEVQIGVGLQMEFDAELSKEEIQDKILEAFKHFLTDNFISVKVDYVREEGKIYDFS